MNTLKELEELRKEYNSYNIPEHPIDIIFYDSLKQMYRDISLAYKKQAKALEKAKQNYTPFVLRYKLK